MSGAYGSVLAFMGASANSPGSLLMMQGVKTVKLRPEGMGRPRS